MNTSLGAEFRTEKLVKLQPALRSEYMVQYEQVKVLQFPKYELLPIRIRIVT